MRNLFIVAGLFLGIMTLNADNKVLKLKGLDGAGKNKTIVLISGDEEYRSEESMPMLAKILSQRHGFDCIVLFSWNETKEYISPRNQQGIIGWHYLNDADLMIIGTRFRKPSIEDCAHITRYLDAGKPVIGFRTATHAFNGKGSFGDKISFKEFGPLILGEGWINHHGKHKKEGARAVIEAENANHVILNSVKDIFAPSDVYGVRKVNKERGDIILLRGEVTKTLEPSSPPVEGKKNINKQALAWLHPYTSPKGTKGLSFTTTMGSSVDFVSEDLRRLLINACYFLTNIEVPSKADVTYVDPFYPSFYGFATEDYWKEHHLTVADFELGKSTALPDIKGSPKWEFRPIKK